MGLFAAYVVKSYPCKNLCTSAAYPMYKPYAPKFNYEDSSLFKTDHFQGVRYIDGILGLPPGFVVNTGA